MYGHGVVKKAVVHSDLELRRMVVTVERGLDCLSLFFLSTYSHVKTTLVFAAIHGLSKIGPKVTKALFSGIFLFIYTHWLPAIRRALAFT